MTNEELTGDGMGGAGGPTEIRKMPGREGSPDPLLVPGDPRGRQPRERPEQAIASGADVAPKQEEALRCRVCWSDLLPSGNPLSKQVCSPECARTAAIGKILQEISGHLAEIAAKRSSF